MVLHENLSIQDNLQFRLARVCTILTYMSSEKTAKMKTRKHNVHTISLQKKKHHGILPSEWALGRCYNLLYYKLIGIRTKICNLMYDIHSP